MYDKNYKYIPQIPKPLLNDFLENRVIPIVGAGFSRNADIPEGLSMPEWNGLGKLAADEITDYIYNNNPIEALSYYEELYSRTKLVELIMNGLHYEEVTNPGVAYEAFCKLFTGTICTTNFDLLLETEMSNLGRQFSIIATPDRLAVGGRDECKIIKLHGDFNHPERMVITERDYDTFIVDNPILTTYVANLFITNTMLLVGYSLDDNDFRSIWQVINNRLGKMAQPAYCIMVNASKDKAATYGRRNVNVINIESEDEDYKIILKDVFEEIKDYVDGARDRKASSTDEKVNEQMTIPAENNRLCFIFCAQSRISRLSEMLYPMLRRMGVTPLVLEDMLMPGENIVDILSTAVRKSKAVIADVTDLSYASRQELLQIRSMKQQDEIFLIGDQKVGSSPSFMQFQILYYCFDMPDDEDIRSEEIQQEFEEKLCDWVSSIYDNDTLDTSDTRVEFSEAQRLFDKEEYSSSVISSYSELEYRLLKLSRENQQVYNKRGYSNPIVSFLNDSKVSDFDRKTGKKFRMLRNSIVHNRYQASEEEAAVFLEFAKKLYGNALHMEE